MTDPISFTSTTPRLALPNLFTAQAQKEFTINEAFARLDALVHCAVEAEADDPPADPADGQCWIVGSAPSGEWSGHAGELACHQVGNWLFSVPLAGMRVFDKGSAQDMRYDGAWVRATSVTAPSGGSVEDVEARAAITGLISALVTAGILSSA